MIHSPGVLLLDEPTAGVDPQSRGRIFAIVKTARDQGAALLYSTHYMEEVEQLANRVILIDRGKVVADGRGAELIALAGREPRSEGVTSLALNKSWARDLAGARELPRGTNGHGASLALTDVNQVPEVLRRAESCGGSVVEFHLHRPNLQDAFLALTGHALRDTP